MLLTYSSVCGEVKLVEEPLSALFGQRRPLESESDCLCSLYSTIADDQLDCDEYSKFVVYNTYLSG